jgi:hypothetical protein
MSAQCRSKLTLAGKDERCKKDLGHPDKHAWWSVDGRIEVTWEKGAGGSSWRRQTAEPFDSTLGGRGE